MIALSNREATIIT